MKVLTLNDGEQIAEIHMLNVGEHFPLFGGSSRGLVASRTASIVIHRVGKMGTQDSEREIFDFYFWEWIARLINEKIEGLTAEANPENVK